MTQKAKERLERYNKVFGHLTSPSSDQSSGMLSPEQIYKREAGMLYERLELAIDERDRLRDQVKKLREALEKCLDEMVGIGGYIESHSWRQGIRDAQAKGNAILKETE
jgi:hypothetical protein